MKGKIQEKLQEINNIFVLTKDFSTRFDSHMGKIYKMIGSLLEQEEQLDPWLENQHGMSFDNIKWEDISHISVEKSYTTRQKNNFQSLP